MLLLLLEANHDEIMLRESRYPWPVKQRIASSHGHLSNRAAADLARQLLHPRLASVVLGHLSENANHAGLAHDTVAEALEKGGYRGELRVAGQETLLEPI